MDGQSILSFLRQLCRDMDAGRPLRRFRWRQAMAPFIVPAALGLSVGGAACNREDCGDGQDNDSDGQVDCADDDCYGVGSCPDPDSIVPPSNEEYAAPNLPEPIHKPPPVAPAPPPEEDEASRPRPMYADDPMPPDLMQKATKSGGLEPGR